MCIYIRQDKRLEYQQYYAVLVQLLSRLAEMTTSTWKLINLINFLIQMSFHVASLQLFILNDLSHD